MDLKRLEFAKQLLGQALTPAQQRYFSEDPEMRIFSASSDPGVTGALAADVVSRAVFSPGCRMAILCQNGEAATEIAESLKVALTRLESLRPELEWKSPGARKFIIDYRCSATTVELRTVPEEPKKRKPKTTPSGAAVCFDEQPGFDHVFLHAASADIRRHWVAEADIIATEGGKVTILACTPQAQGADPDSSALDKVLMGE